MKMIVEDIFRVSQTTQYVRVYDGTKLLYEGNVLSIPLNVMARTVDAIYTACFGVKPITYLVIEV